MPIDYKTFYELPFSKVDKLLAISKEALEEKIQIQLATSLGGILGNKPT